MLTDLGVIFSEHQGIYFQVEICSITLPMSLKEGWQFLTRTLFLYEVVGKCARSLVDRLSFS